MGKEESEGNYRTIRILCRNLVIIRKNEQHQQLQWLIGSPFLPSLTVVSTLRCLHTLQSQPFSPDFTRESDDIRTLVPRGFEVIGALLTSDGSDFKKVAADAIDAARELRKCLCHSGGSDFGGVRYLIGAVVDATDSENDVHFFISNSANFNIIESTDSVLYEDQPEKYIWERGCIVRCELPLKLPVYYSHNNPKDVEAIYMRIAEDFENKFRDPHVAYIIEAPCAPSTDRPQSVVLHGSELNVQREFKYAVSSGSAAELDDNSLSCSRFWSRNKATTSLNPMEENADIIQVSILLNRSKSSQKPAAPVAEYYPVEGAKLLFVNHKLEVLCYVGLDLPFEYVVSELVMHALLDQLNSVKKMILPDLQAQHQLHPYHFMPSGFLHPITAIYELSYGETEIKQVETRRSLHLRLGLPLDRPLLRTANSINLTLKRYTERGNSVRKGSTLLKDVHLSLPSSGVSGGIISLIQGSYEYHHYLQDGFDDSGWGCAYRSLQTIISWFRLQHYTSIDVPSHREIQQSLVDIGDKEHSFIGSREWIGAIELSYVLDKLLGVSCKILNLRSGTELPEKCRELALHFENQGTPVMIGGGVLAYTLLGVDYNESSGDCAFLILDPHYTGSDDLKKIVNAGWCGWKKAVDSKGNQFFLHNKFYNLLLPQRPNMV